MKAMLLTTLRPIDGSSDPLEWSDVPDPVPQSGEVLIRVRACGVCHTELDEIEGRLPPRFLPIIPGHQVIGEVIARGAGVTAPAVGDRVGVGWIHSSTGDAQENLSPQFRGTGCDANGGYAELMTAPANYVFPIPEHLSDVEAAPLMCAGAIGYRALRLTAIRNGDPVGLTGFGGSAHLVLPVVRYLYPQSAVHVFARSPQARQFALRLGADWSGDTHDRPPEPLQAIIDTTPAWTPVIAALACLRPGGRLVINAIRKERHDQDALLRLSYHEHLWMEREVKSVANITGPDIRDFLKIAGKVPLRPTVETYPLNEANRALRELKAGTVRGSKVLLVG